MRPLCWSPWIRRAPSQSAAKAVVRAEDSGVVVEVRGDSGNAAEEILSKATALAQVTPQSAR